VATRVVFMKTLPGWLKIDFRPHSVVRYSCDVTDAKLIPLPYDE
jgi:hypothetical protein